MLFASRRQHRMRLCAHRTLHLPSRSTSATSSRIQTDTVEYCEEILYPRTQFPKQSTSGHPVVYSPLINVAPHTAFTLLMTKAKKCTSDEFERDKFLAVPSARVARMLAPRTFGTGLELVGGSAPKPLAYY